MPQPRFRPPTRVSDQYSRRSIIGADCSEVKSARQKLQVHKLEIITCFRQDRGYNSCLELDKTNYSRPSQIRQGGACDYCARMRTLFDVLSTLYAVHLSSTVQSAPQKKLQGWFQTPLLARPTSSFPIGPTAAIVLVNKLSKT